MDSLTLPPLQPIPPLKLCPYPPSFHILLPRFCLSSHTRSGLQKGFEYPMSSFSSYAYVSHWFRALSLCRVAVLFVVSLSLSFLILYLWNSKLQVQNWIGGKSWYSFLTLLPCYLVTCYMSSPTPLLMQPSPRNSIKRVEIDNKRVIHALIMKNRDK